MIKEAAITLILDKKGNAQSPILNDKVVEHVIDFVSIDWTPFHVVFHMRDGNTCAYKADRVFELVTYDVEE